MRLILTAVVIAAAGLLFAGCGTGPVVIKVPSPSQRVTTRFLHTGERVTLRCGLSFTVPAHYDGNIITGDVAQSQRYDFVSTARGAIKGLLWGFAARSFTPAGVQEERGTFFAWPIVAASRDGTVVVRGIRSTYTTPQGTPTAMSTIAVTIREPGHPTGVVTVLAFGKNASTSPSKVIAQLRSIWRLFAVQGVTLPGEGA